MRTLSAKITLTFAVALVAFAGALVFGIVRVRALQAELSRVREHYLPLGRAIGSLEVLSATPMDFEGHYSLPKRDLAPLRLRRQLLQGPLSQARLFVDRAEASAPSGLERTDIGYVSESLERVETRADAYATALDGFVSAVEAQDRPLAEERYRELEKARVALKEAVEELSRGTDRATRSAVVAAGTHAGTVLLALAILTALAIATGIVASGIIARSLRPIRVLADRARDIGKGNFGEGVAVPRRAGDEVATLATEFNEMIRRLRARDESLRALSVHLESIFEGIRTGLVVIDPNGEISRVNSAAEEIWNRTREQLVGESIDVLPGASVFASRVEGVGSSGKIIRVAGVTVPHPSPDEEGERRLVDVTLIPFPDGVIVVGDDVTERTQMERALLRSEKLAAIGRMSSQITHEVRNPLNSLSLNLELLEDELKAFGNVDTDEAWRVLQALRSEADRLTEVTEGYLGFARLPRPRMEKESLNDIVESLLAFVREEVAAKGVKLEVDLAGQLPAVLADENQIRQALLNIIRNAVEAMREAQEETKGVNGSPRLKVSTRAVEGGVEAVIQDTGPGIDVRDLDRIFDPFYSTKDTGTGVGLPLTQQIIEEHDGTLSCESEKGKGTAFIVRFPEA